MNKDSSTQESTAPIVKTLVAGVPVETAFRLFVEETDSWWPMATHSVGGDQAVACRLEGRVGGRFYEIQRDGSQAEWGQVLTWEPPQRVIFSLHPGRTPDLSTEVEVAFAPEGEGTRLTLIHRGWERCGELAQLERKGYDGGWELILGKYAAQATLQSLSH